jgi:hypothetical protein
MTVKITDAGTMITGPDIEIFRVRVIARGLALEINTGMKMSRGVNTVALVNKITGRNDRRKINALQALVDLVRKTDPEFGTNDSIARALTH